MAAKTFGGTMLSTASRNVGAASAGMVSPGTSSPRPGCTSKAIDSPSTMAITAEST